MIDLTGKFVLARLDKCGQFQVTNPALTYSTREAALAAAKTLGSGLIPMEAERLGSLRLDTHDCQWRWRWGWQLESKVSQVDEAIARLSETLLRGLANVRAVKSQLARLKAERRRVSRA